MDPYFSPYEPVNYSGYYWYPPAQGPERSLTPLSLPATGGRSTVEKETASGPPSSSVSGRSSDRKYSYKVKIGYFEGRSSHSKRWIISINDVDAMYEVYMDGDDITLWCDRKNKPPRKRKKDQSDSEDVPLSKREAKEEEQHKIFNELKEKHGNKSFSDPQLRLWAKLIQSGMHSDYENPPNIPLITGQTKMKKSHAQKNDETSLSGAIVTAANALASVIKPSTSCSKPSTPTSTPKPCTGISPMSRAMLRRSLYTDLQTLQKLYEDSILSASEFEEQKTTLLEELKDLKKV